MLSKELNSKIQTIRELSLLPFVKNLLRLIPHDRGSEAAVILASITRISDSHAVTRSHLTWTQKMMDFVEEYPQHAEVIDELLRYISDQAAIELAMAGASQEDIDGWENDMKKLLT